MTLQRASSHQLPPKTWDRRVNSSVPAADAWAASCDENAPVPANWNELTALGPLLNLFKQAGVVVPQPLELLGLRGHEDVAAARQEGGIGRLSMSMHQHEAWVKQLKLAPAVMRRGHAISSHRGWASMSRSCVDQDRATLRLVSAYGHSQA